ncbi:MAG: DUF1232 domain-containing protein [Schleiferiaceae bacterium]|nr:DUF1232 domain-containing protein [Schleiferiaceae bacterium]
MTHSNSTVDKKRRHLRGALLWRYWRSFFTVVRIVYFWLFKDYPRFPWRSCVALALVLLYVVNPIDLIPDIILGIGWLDDAFFVTLLPFLFRKDVETFNAWKLAKTEKTSSKQS